MVPTTCFSRDQLKRYLLGDLPEPDSELVAIHVESCQSCEATVVELDLEPDTLVSSLRKAGSDVSAPQDSVYQLAAKRAVAHCGNIASAMSPIVTDLPQLRDYELLEPLARGGMGTVYRARHTKLNRMVAIKVLPSRWLKDEAAIARFEREMQAVGSLRHHAIVQATDGGEAAGVHFLVMELIDGVDGSGLIRFCQPLPVAEACEMVRQAAVGMAYVHGQGIIHRDLKPSNLMITRSGEVKVLDLGLARALGDQLVGDELTTVGQLMGTLDFMAPEQIKNSHHVDQRTDVYALGATLYKLLAAKSPHVSSPGEPLLNRLNRMVEQEVQPIESRRGDLPIDLMQLLDRMLSKSPEDRPTGMSEVIEVLTPHCRGAQLSKRVKLAIRNRNRENSSAQIQADSGDGSLWQPAPAVLPSARDRNRGLMTALGGALLALASLGVYFAIQLSQGQLIIETADENVQVQILKAGKPYQQLTIEQQAETFRLGAGQYEIKIISDADNLVVENDRYSLRRGDTWVARIVHRTNANRPSQNPLHDASQLGGAEDTRKAGDTRKDVPTYEGVTLDGWLQLLRTERSAKQFYDACKALGKLVDPADEPKAIKALLTACRYHDDNSSYRSAPGSVRGVRLWSMAQDLLASFDQTNVIKGFSDELSGDEKVDFMLAYLIAETELVAPSVTPELLNQLEGLLGDVNSPIQRDALQVFLSLGKIDRIEASLDQTLDSDSDRMKLFAASALLQHQRRTKRVLEVLRKVCLDAEVRDRAEACWMLGDFGSSAAEAKSELISIVKDEQSEVSMLGVYYPEGAADPRMPYQGNVSVKDAAIRALAEIGDTAVFPVLLDEWLLRTSGARRNDPEVSKWDSGRGNSIANSYTADWVADAIEKLIGMRPVLISARVGERNVYWTVGKFSLADVYRYAFVRDRASSLEDSIAAAEKLFSKAALVEKDQAAEMISRSRDTPTSDELQIELELCQLLAANHSTFAVAEAMLARWTFLRGQGDSHWKEGNREQTLQEYREQIVELIRQSGEQHDEVVVQLTQAISKWPVAAIPLADLLAELKESQQQSVFAASVEKFGIDGPGEHETAVALIRDWAAGEKQQELIDQLLARSTKPNWANLVVGMIVTGIERQRAGEVLTQRFEQEPEQRYFIFRHLIDSLDVGEGIDALMLELIKNEKLSDVARTQRLADGNDFTTSHRALTFLPMLVHVPMSQRDSFVGYLRSVASSDQTDESRAAQDVLNHWSQEIPKVR